jgi:hypothetical protein
MTIFTEARQYSLSRTKLVQSILVLYSHLRREIPWGVTPVAFATQTPYGFLFYAIWATCPVTFYTISMHKNLDRFLNSERVCCGVEWGTHSFVTLI